MVKLKDIAEKLGMGLSTVSEVLNGKENNYISKPKRELILATAKEMGYVPNKMSRGIQGLPTNTVGLVGSLLSVPSTSHLISSLCNAIYDNNLSVLLGDSQNSPVREKALINEFLSRGIDGLLLHSCLRPEELDSLIRGRIPCVGYNQMAQGICVTMSREDAAFMALEHLISKHGRKRIGFIASVIKTNQDKYKGYKAALRKYGIPFRKEYCIDITSELSTETAIGRILERKLDAVFCSNDFVAGHLVKNLGKAGKRVPEEISIIGFDGLEVICELVQPSLTSIKLPAEGISQLAVQLLLEKIKGRDVAERIYYIEPSLRMGNSCGCA